MEEHKKRYRGYTFTCNNYNNEDEERIQSLKYKYLIYGYEIGEKENTPHLQGFIYFKDAKTVSSTRSLLKGCDVRIAKYEIDKKYKISAAINYCKKGEQSHEEWSKLGCKGPNYGKNYKGYEDGIKPLTQKEKGERGDDFWREERKLISEGRLDEVDDKLYITNIRNIKTIYRDEQSKKIKDDTEEEMLWFYGKSGTGKSRYARAKYKNVFLKMCNKWWENYEYESTVLLEDFDSDHKVLVHHLKIWADRYPFSCEIKGIGVKLRPKRIIVTSNYKPQDIWDKEQDLEPILRRFRLVKFTKINNKYMMDNEEIEWDKIEKID